jgi:hypothetical protein
LPASSNNAIDRFVASPVLANALTGRSDADDFEVADFESADFESDGCDTDDGGFGFPLCATTMAVALNAAATMATIATEVDARRIDVMSRM